MRGMDADAPECNMSVNAQPQTPPPLPPPQPAAAATATMWVNAQTNVPPTKDTNTTKMKGSFSAPPPPGMARGWSVDQVVLFVEGLGLGHIVEPFRENAIDGQMLVELSASDLCGELGLTKLQAKKVLARLPSNNH